MHTWVVIVSTVKLLATPQSHIKVKRATLKSWEWPGDEAIVKQYGATILIVCKERTLSYMCAF